MRDKMAAKKSLGQLMLSDFLVFGRFFCVRWLCLLGAWNVLLAPTLNWPQLSAFVAAVLTLGWILGLTLIGE